MRLPLALGAFLCVACVAVAGSFRHPGVLLSAEQLQVMREGVREGREPWKSAHDKMAGSRFAALDYTPSPREVVGCGPYSKPSFGCGEEKNDAVAAYTHALLWTITENPAHARKAIEVLNAWAATVQRHEGHNAPLQSAWVASLFPRAAEIIRHTSNLWPAEEVARFSEMLYRAYLPHIEEGRPHYNGNWELSFIEAMLHCGVFLDDPRLFDKAISMWRLRVPAYFYLESDGPAPVFPPLAGKTTHEELVKYWYGQERFVDGLGQETCRDFGHLQMGLAAMIDTAETARIHGVDLYGAEEKRIVTAMEFHASYLLGAPIPSWLGNGKLDLRTIATWEIAFAHYHGRRGLPLPKTAELIRTKVRPSGTAVFMVWETLTHGLPLAAAPDASSKAQASLD